MAYELSAGGLPECVLTSWSRHASSSSTGSNEGFQDSGLASPSRHVGRQHVLVPMLSVVVVELCQSRFQRLRASAALPACPCQQRPSHLHSLAAASGQQLQEAACRGLAVQNPAVHQLDDLGCAARCTQYLRPAAAETRSMAQCCEEAVRKVWGSCKAAIMATSFNRQPMVAQNKHCWREAVPPDDIEGTTDVPHIVICCQVCQYAGAQVPKRAIQAVEHDDQHVHTPSSHRRGLHRTPAVAAVGVQLAGGQDLRQRGSGHARSEQLVRPAACAHPAAGEVGAALAPPCRQTPVAA